MSFPVGLPPAVRVIDTHVHLWTARSPWMAWLADRPDHWDIVRRDFTWDELRGELDRAGVGELILVQACTTPLETRALLEIASREASVLGVVGWVSLRSAAATEGDLASFGGPGAAKLVGVRNNHAWLPDGDILASPDVLASCRLLADRRLPLDLHFPDYRTLPLAIALAEQVPHGVYVIDHLGKPALDDEDAFVPWAAAMVELSQLPNVYVKYSGWATFVRRTLASEVRRHIDLVLERFGPERVMFGSNWPVALVGGTYLDTYRASLEAVSGLSPAGLGSLLRGAATRCYFGAAGSAPLDPSKPGGDLVYDSVSDTPAP